MSTNSRRTILLATDHQHSVLSALVATRPHPIAYTPYGHRPAENGLLSLLGFNGELPDSLTGHYHLGNGYRQFNPVLMRFNSPDSWSPFGDGGLNAYGYCDGDPANRSDPTGHVNVMKILGNIFNNAKKEAIVKRVIDEAVSKYRGGEELLFDPKIMKKSGIKIPEKIDKYKLASDESLQNKIHAQNVHEFKYGKPKNEKIIKMENKYWDYQYKYTKRTSYEVIADAKERFYKENPYSHSKITGATTEIKFDRAQFLKENKSNILIEKNFLIRHGN